MLEKRRGKPISPLVPQRLIPLDDLAAPFQIENQPVRGRLVRLGAAVDEILTRHDYPEAVANLLGEACALAALVGASLKFEGRLIVQAQGDGPVSYVVADYDTEGSLRGYCRYDAERLADAQAEAGFGAPGAKALLGEGVFIMTIDQGPDTERYQGVTPIEGETLAFCAERYFAQSEQTPTRVRLAVGQSDDGSGPKWRAGGILMQNIAEDDARGATAEAWREAQSLFETVGEDELIDPTLTPETLLYRLFHEQRRAPLHRPAAAAPSAAARGAHPDGAAVVRRRPSAPRWSRPTAASTSPANTARASTRSSRRRSGRGSGRLQRRFDVARQVAGAFQPDGQPHPAGGQADLQPLLLGHRAVGGGGGVGGHGLGVAEVVGDVDDLQRVQEVERRRPGRRGRRRPGCRRRSSRCRRRSSAAGDLVLRMVGAAGIAASLHLGVGGDQVGQRGGGVASGGARAGPASPGPSAAPRR